MRLIDADALMAVLKNNCKPELCHDCGSAWCKNVCPKNDYIDLINDAPSIDKVINVYPNGEVIVQEGKWFDYVDDSLLKARHGKYVIYDVDFLLDNLAREVSIMEQVRQMRDREI